MFFVIKEASDIISNLWHLFMLNGSVYECNLLSASAHIQSAFSEIRKDSDQSTDAKCLMKVNTRNFGKFFIKSG